MKTLIFAYGSNMKTERMIDRIPSAKPLGRAYIKDKKLVCNKKSKDGSGKANIVNSYNDIVWGVLYEIDTSQLSSLDRFESGYDQISLKVMMEDGSVVKAQAYISERITSKPVPFDWYKEYILEGAREHGLPSDYVKILEQLPYIVTNAAN